MNLELPASVLLSSPYDVRNECLALVDAVTTTVPAFSLLLQTCPTLKIMDSRCDEIVMSYIFMNISASREIARRLSSSFLIWFASWKFSQESA